MSQQSFKVINALIYSIRPSASLGACVLVLAAYQPTTEDLGEISLLMISTFFGSAFCFIVNDIFDRQKDLLNKKARPIATGVIPYDLAIKVAILFAVIFLVSCWYLGLTIFLLAIGFLLLAWTYSYINNKTGLLANAIVGFIVAGTQWGVAIIKPDELLWISSFFLFFFTIPREVLLDWLDIPGDKKWGKNSFPINFSTFHTSTLIAGCLVMCSISIYFVEKQASSAETMAFFVLAVVTSWGSFLPFCIRPANRSALLGVRLSHISYTFLILALFFR